MKWIDLLLVEKEIGGIIIEYYNESNICILSGLKFDHKVSEVVIGGLRYNGKTTIETIQQRFPEYCQIISEINIYQAPDKYSICKSPINYNGQMTDSSLMFLFFDGRLSQIDIYLPN